MECSRLEAASRGRATGGTAPAAMVRPRAMAWEDRYSPADSTCARGMDPPPVAQRRARCSQTWPAG